MQNPSRVHHARNTSSDTGFVSNKTTKILKPPPRCHTQNIEDANIANMNDVNSLMLHSAKTTSSRLRIRINKKPKDFQAFLLIPRLIKPRIPIWLMGTKAPSNLQRPPVKERTHLTRLPSIATLCREYIANSSLSLRLDALPEVSGTPIWLIWMIQTPLKFQRPRVKERTHIDETTNYLQVFTSMPYFPDA
jgi:hypothetical protein